MRQEFGANGLCIQRNELSQLIGDIDLGKLALPELQRPFVWKKVEVRDLFDSMYRGFPVGYLMLWNAADVDAVEIGKADLGLALAAGTHRWYLLGQAFPWVSKSTLDSASLADVPDQTTNWKAWK